MSRVTVRNNWRKSIEKPCDTVALQKLLTTIGFPSVTLDLIGGGIRNNVFLKV